MQFGRDNADAGCTVMVFHSDHDDEDWLNQMIGTYQSQDNVQWENASAYRGPVIEGVLGHGSFTNVTPNLNFMIWIASTNGHCVIVTPWAAESDFKPLEAEFMSLIDSF